MKDDVRITARLTSLQPCQSAEFSTRVFTPIKAEDIYGTPVPAMDRLSVNAYMADAEAYCYRNDLIGDVTHNEYEQAEREAMQLLAVNVVKAVRYLQAEFRPPHTHYATQKIERRFSTAMGDDIKGVHSTLSITVYRVK